jgi:hypothetical protein
LRLVDAENGATCSRNEQPISWNRQGPAGANGATNVVVRYQDVSGVLGMAVSGTASCQSGERAVGGGYDAGGNGSQLIPFEDHPEPAGQGATPTGWHVEIGVPDTTYAFGLGRVYVVCASP